MPQECLDRRRPPGARHGTPSSGRRCQRFARTAKGTVHHPSRLHTRAPTHLRTAWPEPRILVGLDPGAHFVSGGPELDPRLGCGQLTPTFPHDAPQWVATNFPGIGRKKIAPQCRFFLPIFASWRWTATKRGISRTCDPIARLQFRKIRGV